MHTDAGLSYYSCTHVVRMMHLLFLAKYIGGVKTLQFHVKRSLCGLYSSYDTPTTAYTPT